MSCKVSTVVQAECGIVEFKGLMEKQDLDTDTDMDTDMDTDLLKTALFAARISQSLEIPACRFLRLYTIGGLDYWTGLLDSPKIP